MTSHGSEQPVIFFKGQDLSTNLKCNPRDHKEELQSCNLSSSCEILAIRWNTCNQWNQWGKIRCIGAAQRTCRRHGKLFLRSATDCAMCILIFTLSTFPGYAAHLQISTILFFIKGIVQNVGNYTYLLSCRELDEKINTPLEANSGIHLRKSQARKRVYTFP